MKRYSLWVKSLCFFLSVVTLLCIAVSALGILLAESMSMYTADDHKSWRYNRSEEMAQTLADQVIHDYAGEFSQCPRWLLEQTGYVHSIKNGMSWYELSEEDWYYEILDSSGKIVASTKKELEDPLVFAFGGMSCAYPVIVVQPEDVPIPETTIPDIPEAPDGTEPTTEPVEVPSETWSGEIFHADEYYNIYHDPNTDEEVWVQYNDLMNYQVNIAVRAAHSNHYVSNGFSMAFLEWLFFARYGLIAITAVSFLLFTVAFIFLVSLAGRDSKTGEVAPKALNRLPLDLYLTAAVGITIFGCMAAYELLDMLFGKTSYNVLVIVLLCGCGIIVATTDVGFFMALAAQFKLPSGFWWRHSICGRILKWVWKAVRFCWKCFLKLFALLPVIWEWLLIGFVLVLGLLVTMLITFETSFWPILLWWCGICVTVVGYGGWCYGNIRKGIKRMNAGNLNEKINTRYLIGSFKSVAEELNALADVAAVAAEKQLKSERMKTELITNVSHDIKTPLTSVINYVDLLQQPHTEEEGEQYLEVLSRQSLRLKKLVEDLMDMSKASTGNVEVNPVSMDAVEAVNQALGEFSDKLDAARLTPVFRSPNSQLHMLADGKLTWRVLSNLLSNVVKYALPGTRVYIDLLRLDKSVMLSIKNISREELNITAEELTERFVRGDTSRNTEGSGLGLNIAQSLMQLQQGSMEIMVDGDLFKVTLTFPTE